MEYRKLGRTGLAVSVIGVGTEHLERKRETMDSVLHKAVDAGVNYVDLLYIEPDYWDLFGPVLRLYRDKLVLAAHWGGGPRYDMDYCRRTFANILSCVGNYYVEVAMLTMVDTERKWNVWAQAAMEHLLRYKERGHIGAIAMSTHRAPMALKAVNSGLIDALLFPLNLTSHVVEPEIALCQACADQGIGLVAMKPYRGGTLFVADGEPSGITPAQCLHYVLSLPVSTTVPGVKNVEELRAALHYWEATDEEKNYGPVLTDVHRYLEGRCTSCNHCLPCPQEIDIAQVMGLVFWAQWALEEDNDEKEEILTAYAALQAKASECVECGDCMERCPFEVGIIAKMRTAAEVFESVGL